MSVHLQRVVRSVSFIFVVLLTAVFDVVSVQAEAIEEILVTATRRAESIQDVPYSISALTGEQLEAAGVFNLADLTRNIPGVAFADLGVRSASINNQLILRGLNAAAAGGVNGFLANNTPAGVSTYFNDTPLFTNLKINDIERVEVLRGPQGTLYGANAIGGTLRFIFNKPDTEKFTAKIDAGISFPEHSDDTTYSVDGVVNVPLSDTIALRVAAGYEEIAGFIDANGFAVGGIGGATLVDPTAPFTSPVLTAPQEDIDGADIYYIRTSLLWNITDSIEAFFTYHRQVDDAEGFSAETPGGTSRTHDQVFKAPFNRETDLFSLELDIDLGFALLESSTGYTQNEASTRPGTGISGLIRSLDTTLGGFGFGGYPFFNPGLVGFYNEDLNEDSFIQEIRLVSQNESALSWIAGFYYQDIERTRAENIFVPGFANFANTPSHPFVAPAPLSFANLLAGALGVLPQSISNELFLSIDENIKTEDIAIFGELSYEVTEQWTVTFGARVFWNEVNTNLDFSQPLSGVIASVPLGNPNGAGSVSAGSDVQSEIFKVNTSYEINDDHTAYFNWAEGFRRGGGNGTPTSGPIGEDVSLIVFTPDTVTNYEVGLKGLLSDRLTYTLAYFHIDWEDPQIPTNSAGGMPIVINAGQARTRGVEFETSLGLTEGLTVSGGYSYVDAEFTQDFVSALTPVSMVSTLSASDGNRLPGVPEHSATWAFDYVRPVNFLGSSKVHARLDASYRSSVVTASSATADQYTELNGFSIWNASLGWSNDKWRARVFVRNIADEEGVGAVLRDFANAGANENLDFLSRPRTFGFTLGYTF